MIPSVAYFANQFAASEGHGMLRYAHELHDAIAALGGARLIPSAAWSDLDSPSLTALQEKTGLTLMPTGRRATSLAWTLAGVPLMEWMMRDRIDVVHSVCMGYPVATRRPLVVTVHDLGPLTHPEFFSHNRPWVMERALRQAVDRAATIVAISQATADEIVSLHPSASRRVRVVHSGVSQKFFDPVTDEALREISLPPDDTPFVLAAGKISPRKNIQGLLRALKAVEHDIPHHVVLTGGNGWDVELIREELDQTGLHDRVHMLGFVSDDALRALYRRAAVYVHPSLYEGFGLTVLEAMACGVPVITSNSSSLPEVAGDAAYLVDPLDADDIARALLEIIDNSTQSDRMRVLGLERARSFSWDTTARTMLAIYSDAAAS